jgi:hypothetical protein
VNDLDRWVNREGPEPDDICDLLDAGCDDRTPEHVERMKRRLYAALAVDRRRWARRKALKRTLRRGLLAACLVFALVLGLRRAAPPDLVMALRLLPNAGTAAPNHLADTEGSALPAVPSVSVTPRSPGPPRRPGRERPATL